MTNPTIRRTALALLVAGALTGCTMAPHYVRPDAPVANTYPDETNAQSNGAKESARKATDIGWREFFTDPRLQALIASALENNRDLRVAALRIEEARAQYRIQAADLYPNLNLNASATHARVPDFLSSNGESSVGTTYQVGVGIAAFELDFFGRVRSLKDEALAKYLSTEEARRSAQIGVIAEVAKAYLAERAFAEQQELAKQTYDSRQSAYTLSKQRYDVGASSALDLKLNETQMLSARAALAALARQRAQSINALTLLVGTPPSGELPPPQPLSGQNIVSDLPAGLPSDLLMLRPDIRAAEQSLIAANANIGAARAAFFPRIALTANAGTASTSLSGLFDAGSRTWSFTPQLTLPIFEAGRNVANLQLSDVRKNIAVANYEKSIQTAFREVADALVARGALDDQVDAQTAFLAASTDRLNLTQQRFDNGIASSLDLLDAKRDLFIAQQSLVQTQLLRLTNAVDLYAALGGGLREAATGS